jgi:hypothetical protein
MFTKLKMVSAISLLYASSAMADLSGAKGTLNNIDSAVNDAVTKATRLFEENQGAKMSSAFSVLKDGQNPYLQTLRITPDYKVEIKLASASKNGGGYTVPVAKGLLGMDIVLIPVYQNGDEKISSWECVTNADRNIQEFIGATAKEYSASYIREATSNTYLSLCIYMNKDLVNGSSNGSGGSSSSSNSNSPGNSGNSNGNNGNNGNNNGKGNS